VCCVRRSLLGLGTDALEGAVVLGPAGEGRLDEVRALLGHVCCDAPGHALELAAHILGAHSRLVELALFEIERHNTYSSVVTLSLFPAERQQLHSNFSPDHTPHRLQPGKNLCTLQSGDIRVASKCISSLHPGCGIIRYIARQTTLNLAQTYSSIGMCTTMLMLAQMNV